MTDNEQDLAAVIPAYETRKGWSTSIVDVIDCIRELAIDGLLTDGGYHKQWYLERILEGLGVDLEQLRRELMEDDYDWEPGVAP